MCNQNNLQRIIQQRTGDGKIIADFLFDTVQGKTPDVKACRRMEAMKYIVRLGSADQPDKEDTQFWGLIPTPEELATTRHSRAEPAPSEGRGGNPVEQGTGGPFPSTGEGRDGGENPTNPVIPTKNSQPTTQYSQLNTDDSPDCYYEPLSPEDQAIFDYQTLIDSGEYKEGEIEIQPPSEAAHQEYAATLKWIRQAATDEGIPLLPNPLSGTLTHPNIRSP